MRTPIGRLRAIALTEGVSFLILLFIAMPLKYVAGIPVAVKVAGWLHGVLFVMLLGVLFETQRWLSWSRKQTAQVVLAALLPFGPFVIDGRLRREQVSWSKRPPDHHSA
jgi:integral membrane protein